MKTNGRTVGLEMKWISGIIYSILLFASPISGYGQEEKPSPFIFTKNRLSVTLKNGFNKTHFTPTSGTQTPSSGIGNIHQLNIDYTFSLGDHFGLTMGGGLGAFPFMFRVAPAGQFEGTSGWAYWHLVDYNFFSNLKIGVEYDRWLTNKYSLNINLGLGSNFSTSYGSSIGGTSDFGKDYSFKYNYPGNAIPYLYFGSGVSKKLKNDNLIGLSLSYERFSEPIYSGSYTMYNSQELGSLTNKGNNFSVGLQYVFTRANKFKLTEEKMLSDQITYKAAKKKYKKERRLIDPKSVLIGASGGMFFTRNTIPSNVNYLKTVWTPSFVVQGDAEIGFKKNRFWQFGFALKGYTTGEKIDRPEISFWTSSSAFVSPSISGGVGMRLVGKRNNINYLNVSGGLTLNYNFSWKGKAGSSVSQISTPDGDELYKLEVEDYNTSHFFSTLYLNLSRDFQLTKDLYFSLDYRLNFGIMNTMERYISFFEQPNYDTPQQVTLGINGTGNAFQLGLKYKFVSKKK